MTENDKILINAFVDNEASSEEINYVEHLIEKNDDALNYLNMLKKANIEFNNFFGDIDLSKDFQKDKPSLMKLVYGFFQKPIFNYSTSFESASKLIQKPILTYAATAVIFFGIGTQFIDNGFKESNLEFKYLVLRSEKNEEQLMVIIDEMIKKEIKTAKIDSELYDQIIIFPKNKSDCVLFELNGNVNSIGKYCLDTEYIQISNID